MTRVIAACLVLVALGGCAHTTPPSGDAGASNDSAAADAGSPDAGGARLLPNANGWWRGAVVYEVFVRSFADADRDGVGDLRGLTARLDYLNDGQPGGQDLGVDALWLMPIHPSPSYHGYDVTDYRGVNPDYGTLGDFDALVTAAHARGMRVILDLVLNHSSSRHPWFVDSRTGPGAPKRDWYSWRADPPAWKRPWDGGPVWYRTGDASYYAIFWEGMPDLNLGNPAVEAEMLDTMRFWLRRKVDGFRIDAARHLFESADGQLADVAETHAFIRRVRAALQPEFPEMLLVAEAWTTADVVQKYYGAGDEYQLAFSFDLAGALKGSVADGLRASVVQTLARAQDTYVDRGFEAPFLANHDMPRVMRELRGDAGAARVAAAALLAMPGTPFLYYGEELGMQGGAGGADEEKRTIMRWNASEPGYGFTEGPATWHAVPDEAAGTDVATQQADPRSLRSLYQQLLAVRHGAPALARGDASMPAIEGGGRGTFALLRTLDRAAGEGSRVLFVANVAATPGEAFTVTVAGTPQVIFAEGLDAAPTPAAGGTLSFAPLGPRGFAFVALGPPAAPPPD